MSRPHWEYFLAIESDLDKCSRYVEFDEDNFGVYSVEFARIIMVAASEFESVAKKLCKLIDPNGSAQNMGVYRQAILSQYPRFAENLVLSPRHKLTLKPWDGLTDCTSPKWWKDYTKIKHSREANFTLGNLENAMNSVAALLIAILHLYRHEQGGGDVYIDAFHSPKIFSSLANDDKNDNGWEEASISIPYTLR